MDISAYLQCTLRSRYTDTDVRGGVDYSYVLAAVRPDGSEVRSPVTRVRTIPVGVALAQNHPNPFNPITTIEFTLPLSQTVRLSVYDTGGRRVTTLVDGRRPEGLNQVSWDGRDSGGRAVSSGVYFYRLQSDDVTLTRKMILLK